MIGTSRRDFIAGAGASIAAMAVPAWAQAKAPDFKWSALLHLGNNMWDDFGPEGPDGRAKSAAERKLRPNPFKLDSKGPRESKYCSYVRTTDEEWIGSVNQAAACGVNEIIIDLGEAIVYPSHPELAVAGSWSVEKFRKELARMRALGITPVPKLNFATTHDSWLKYYHRMVSTPTYYKVVADIIRDVCEIFDKPYRFHIGMDEELPNMMRNDYMTVVRQGEQWWYDFNFIVKEVERHGARATAFGNAFCYHRSEFMKHASKDVIWGTGYYRVAPDPTPYDAVFVENPKNWDEYKNCLAACYKMLPDAGFDIEAGCSNIYIDTSIDLMMRYFSERLQGPHLKAICCMPWDDCGPRTDKQLAAFAAAKQKYFS